MALQITQSKGVFHLNGKINSSTVRSFIIYFEHFILKNKNTTINLNEIKEIDSDGLKAIETLIAIAYRHQKIFSFIGYNAKDIHEHFKKN